jgi:hypothetical protein
MPVFSPTKACAATTRQAACSVVTTGPSALLNLGLILMCDAAGCRKAYAIPPCLYACGDGLYIVATLARYLPNGYARYLPDCSSHRQASLLPVHSHVTGKVVVITKDQQNFRHFMPQCVCKAHPQHASNVPVALAAAAAAAAMPAQVVTEVQGAPHLHHLMRSYESLEGHSSKMTRRSRDRSVKRSAPKRYQPAPMLLLLLLNWVRAMPDRPFMSSKSSNGMHIWVVSCVRKVQASFQQQCHC